MSEFPLGQCKVNSINMYLIPPWNMYSNSSRLLCCTWILFVFFGSCRCLWLTLLTCSLTALNPCFLLPSQVLYQQFKFFLNLYFLVVACSQFVPSLKIGYLYTYWAPLVNAHQFLLCLVLHEIYFGLSKLVRPGLCHKCCLCVFVGVIIVNLKLKWWVY